MHLPKDIAKNYIPVGKMKMQTPWFELLILGGMAGAFTGFAASGANAVSATVESASIARLLSGLVFPAGVIMSVLAGAELFTGNCLTIMHLLEKELRLRNVIESMCFIYIGNLIGGTFIAWLCYAGNQFSLYNGTLAVATIGVAVAKTSHTFGAAVALGILCNFLVCIAVWMGFAGKTVTDKILALYAPIFMFVLCGFENAVANMYYIPAGLFAKMNPTYAELAISSGLDISGLTWGSFFANNLLPVTIGNIIGGTIFVGGVYWLVYLKDKEGGVD